MIAHPAVRRGGIGFGVFTIAMVVLCAIARLYE
jgi:hypothetical protein